MRLVASLALFAAFGCGSPTTPDDPPSKPTPGSRGAPIEVSMADLHGAYVASLIQADQRYTKRHVQTTGYLVAPPESVDGGYCFALSITAENVGRTNKEPHVRASVATADAAAFAQAKPGDLLTVRGLCTGASKIGSDLVIHINPCVRVKP